MNDKFSVAFNKVCKSCFLFAYENSQLGSLERRKLTSGILFNLTLLRTIGAQFKTPLNLCALLPGCRGVSWGPMSHVTVILGSYMPCCRDVRGFRNPFEPSVPYCWEIRGTFSGAFTCNAERKFTMVAIHFKHKSTVMNT